MPVKKMPSPTAKQRFPELHRKFKDLSSAELADIQSSLNDRVQVAKNRITRAAAETRVAETEARDSNNALLVIKEILAVR